MLLSGHTIFTLRRSNLVWGRGLGLWSSVIVCCVLSLGCRPEERTVQNDRPLIVHVDLPSSAPTQAGLEWPADIARAEQEDSGTAERATPDTHLAETEAASGASILHEQRVASQAESPPVPAGLPQQPVQLGRVTVAVLNVRIEPSLQAARIGLLHRTTLIEILEEQSGWYHILAYAGRLQGWVTKRYVTALSADASSTARRSR